MLCFITDFQEWVLNAFPAHRALEEYDGATYAYVYFYLLVKRRTMYFFSTLILPCVLIGNMSQ